MQIKPSICAIAALAAAAALNPPHAGADPQRCDGAFCVPGITRIGSTPAGPCNPHGPRYAFGVYPPKANTFSFLCHHSGQWTLAPVLIGVRLPGDPCPAGVGSYARGVAAQSPEGFPMLCNDGGRFVIYIDNIG